MISGMKLTSGFSGRICLEKEAHGILKKQVKRLIPIGLVIVLIFIGVYWAFFDIQRIRGQEIVQEISSPDGANIITVYRNNGGATTAYAVLCSVKKQQSARERNFYWEDHCSEAEVQWLDDDTAVVNGRKLDVWTESYDYRND